MEAHLLPSPVHELRYVAQRILEAQLNDGRELGDIAVIVRNGGQLSQLQRYLAGQGIPVRIPVAESAVRDEVAVRPLLDAYAVALDPAVLTPESAVSLLTSRIGGATAIELRRLRQSLRREELLGGGGRTSDVLLVEALLEPGALATPGHRGALRPPDCPDDPAPAGTRPRPPAATPRRCSGRSGIPPASPPAGPRPPSPEDRPGPGPTGTSMP